MNNTVKHPLSTPSQRKMRFAALDVSLPPAAPDNHAAERRADRATPVSMPINTHVVFLDIDGVCHQVDDPRGPFRPRCMVQLKKVIHGSGASICLSSSWRESDWGREKVDKYLVAHDMPEVSWCTPLPEEGYNTRADEILSWCVAQPPTLHSAPHQRAQSVPTASVQRSHPPLHWPRAVVAAACHLLAVFRALLPTGRAVLIRWGAVTWQVATAPGGHTLGGAGRPRPDLGRQQRRDSRGDGRSLCADRP